LDSLFGPRPEFQCNALLGSGSKSATDVVAADDEILPVIGASSDQYMYVGIISVPMIDGDPIESGAKVAFGVRHQFSRKRSQVRHLLRIFRRNDESEVVAVIATSFSKAPFIRLIRMTIEHPGVCAIPGDPIPLEIG
jgi:hypothetical protein